MKTKYSLSKVLILIYIFIVSCTDTNEVIKNQVNELELFEIQRMAEDHNIYLNDIHDNYGDISLKTSIETQEVRSYLFAKYVGESDTAEYFNFSRKVQKVQNVSDLLENVIEKAYFNRIKLKLEESKSLGIEELCDQIDFIMAEVQLDKRDFFKTPILLYAETIKKSAYYWAPESIGGSGIGANIIAKRAAFRNKNTADWRNIVETDASYMAIGMIGLVSYGSWEVLFGPDKFALGDAALIWVSSEAALSSALFG